MRRKNPADDILINRYTEGQDDLLGNARTSPTKITLKRKYLQLTRWISE